MKNKLINIIKGQVVNMIGIYIKNSFQLLFFFLYLICNNWIECSFNIIIYNYIQLYIITNYFTYII